MEPSETSWIKKNWQQKLVALFSAILIWVFVSHSIISTKTVPNVPVRIINLPHDKTVAGLLPNGLYNRRINLTLSGTKDIVEQLEPGDLEVLLDASQSPDQWVVQVGKKNLISLNPDIDLNKHISTISQPELVIKLSRLAHAKVPIWIEMEGTPPKGYEYLDFFPHTLMQEVVGPAEELDRLEEEGITLSFNLNEISKQDLDVLSTRISETQEDEVSYKIPSSWRKVPISCMPYGLQSLNDPLADQLRIDFLKESLVPLEQNIPIYIYFPLETSSELNPKNISLGYNETVQQKNGIPYFAKPLYVRGSSSRFIEIVRSQLCIMINAFSEDGKLSWNVGLVNPNPIEDKYVKAMTSEYDSRLNTQKDIEAHEKILRQRFREYLHNLRLYTGKDRKLTLNCRVEDEKIIVAAESTRVR